MKYLLYILTFSLLLNTVSGQVNTDQLGHFAKFINPDFFAYENLYYGQVKFIPAQLSSTEKKQTFIYTRNQKGISKNQRLFSELYCDVKSSLYEAAQCKEQPALLRYTCFEGYKSKSFLDFSVSLSSGGGSIRKDKTGSENELLFNYYINNKKEITQIESFASSGFPGQAFSIRIIDSMYCVRNDTLLLNMNSSESQYYTSDSKNRPLQLWQYDDMNRLRQYREYTYSDLGVLKVDSTTISWEGNKVRKVKFKDNFSVFYYDEKNKIASIENFKGSAMVNAYYFLYTYDLKGNWITYELKEYDPRKNKQWRKYFIRRTITYR